MSRRQRAYSEFSHAGDSFDDPQRMLRELHMRRWDARMVNPRIVRVYDRDDGERICSREVEGVDKTASSCTLLHYGADGKQDEVGCEFFVLVL